MRLFGETGVVFTVTLVRELILRSAPGSGGPPTDLIVLGVAFVFVPLEILHALINEQQVLNA